MRKAIIITCLTYLVFFFPLLNSNTFIGGEDPEGYHYPVKYFLYQSLQKGEFPFYTQRIFSGFPVYADPTAGYLNPLNILFVMLFGPFNYYKIMHFIFYLLGSLSLFYFLKRKFGDNLLAFAASNLVYFFNLFNLYHQKHFEIILSVYTLPLCLLLLDKFLTKADIKKLIFLGGILLFDFYNGSFQILLLKLAVLGVYIVLFDNKLVLNVRKYAVFLVLFVLLCLPLLIPAFLLYTESSRKGGSYKLYEGSFAPIMAVNIIYPFITGKDGDYKWNQVNNEYFIHETYIYQGVSVVIFGFLGLFLLKDKKIMIFSSVLILLFVVLAFISYVPVLNNIKIPIISMFRYWGRSTILLSLVLSIGTNVFFIGDTSSLAIRNIKQYLRIYRIPVLFFILILLFSLTSENTTKAFNLFLNGAIKKDIYMIFWILILVSILISLKLKKIKMIFIILMADIVFFGIQVMATQFVNMNQIKVQERILIPDDSIYKKVYVYNDAVYKNMGLYYNSNGIFGYSQMEPELYSKYLYDVGFADVKVPTSFSDTSIKFNKYNTYDFYQKLTDTLGVNQILNSLGDVIYLQNDNSLPYIKGENIKYLNVSQSEISFKIDSSEEHMVKTFIRSYKDWDAFVDGVKILPDYSDIFIKFNLSKGEHTVIFRYNPTVFISTILLSFMSVVVITSTYAAIRIYKNGRI